MNLCFYSQLSLSLDPISGMQAFYCPIGLALIGTNLPEKLPIIVIKSALDSEDPPRL